MHWTPAKPEKRRSSRDIQWNERSSELFMELMNPIKLHLRSVHRIIYKHEHELELSFPNRVVDFFFSLSASIDEKERENRFLPFLLKMFLIFLEKRRKGSSTKPKEKKSTAPKKTAESTWKRYKKKFRKKFSLFLAKQTSRDVDEKLMAMPCAAFRAKTAGGWAEYLDCVTRHSPITAEAC